MSVAAAYSVRAPEWILTYQGVNISGDVSTMVRSIEYVDRLNSASGEVEVVLEDHAKRWQGAWYPALGDNLSIQIGYQGEALLPCGDFQIDQLELSGPPDVFRLRCLGAYVTPSMRTRISVGYENMTVIDIASMIAGKYGLELMTASAQTDISFERVTQRHETDLGFLQRIANENDYDFSVRGTQMVFYARAALESALSVYTITRQTVERFSFVNRTQGIFRTAEVSYLDPDSKQLINMSVDAATQSPSADTLKIVTRCESPAQSAQKAAAALHFKNRRFTRVELTSPGTPVLCAGNNVNLKGWGALDGIYLIETAHHRVSRAKGYTTSIEARRIA